jgi:hypothetical protein
MSLLNKKCEITQTGNEYGVYWVQAKGRVLLRLFKTAADALFFVQCRKGTLVK